MFSFLKGVKSPSVSYALLGIDMHSHILPGIDDGAPDLKTSVFLIKGLMQFGFESFIATPHIYHELYPNTNETIETALRDTRKALNDAGIQVRLEAAAEYMLDDHFEQLLETTPLRTLPGNRVLIEMSPLSAPPNLDYILFRMQLKGYVPLIAHPERYLFVKTNKARYLDWHDRGYELQLNLLSLTGYYGPSVRDLGLYLLKNKLVHFAGTDLHHTKHLELLEKTLKDKNLQKLLQYEGLQNKKLFQN